MSQFARPFRVTYPDGFVLDGVQFPSGRCVLDYNDSTTGRLVEAAVSFVALANVKPGAVIEWADGGQP